MKQIVPEIYVKHCKKALEFYQSLFGGTVKNLQMSDDLPMFQDMKDKVIHSELHVNERCIFYFVDVLDEHRAQTGNVTLMLHLDSRLEAERIYHGLQKGGAVLMELQQTFLGAYHAIVTDRFGAPWALNFDEANG